MDRLITISELARRAGVRPSTVRYYEREGLLAPVSRTDGNYRQYDGGALDRLLFIRAAKPLGFTLDDIRALLALEEDAIAPCAEVRRLIAGRLDAVNRQLEALSSSQRVLSAYLERCTTAIGDERCAMLEELSYKD